MPRYTTPKGITFKQFEEVLSVPILKEYMYSRKRKRRVRYLYACLVYFDMKHGEYYTSQHISEMGLKYNPLDASALSLSTQSIGQHMATMCRLGIVNFITIKSKRHYYKVIE